MQLIKSSTIAAWANIEARQVGMGIGIAAHGLLHVPLL